MGYVLAVTWVAKPGKEDAVAEALRKMVPLTQAEPGCVHYYGTSRPTIPAVSSCSRSTRTRTGLQAHAESEHFKRYVAGEALQRLESRERLHYVPLRPTA